jgi:hypothetical protein
VRLLGTPFEDSGRATPVLSPLRALPAFLALEADLAAVIEAQGW